MSKALDPVSRNSFFSNLRNNLTAVSQLKLPIYQGNRDFYLFINSFINFYILFIYIYYNLLIYLLING